ncbi:uncharacterized protein CEXT_546971 [Caerostris extrusa]|uniref:Uncharacterized protein n=1 Tax=Caerostris extrusa TaxID=172846 RepID=A0AAV4PM18_CAEEX|nr:uncharacterized protein CEXT_546971 [Caerostris extrusa]
MYLGSVVAVCVLCGRSLWRTARAAEVRRAFEMRGLGALVPDSWTEGNDLKLCPSSQTCCSISMENKYEEAGRKDLKNLLQGVDSYLKTLISTSATKFRGTNPKRPEIQMQVNSVSTQLKVDLTHLPALHLRTPPSNTPLPEISVNCGANFI